MARPAIAHISLAAFRHNYRVAKACHGGKALAVVKANAYGHGAVQCAQSISNEADGFAVACLEEALQLRQAGIKNPILLLEGFFEAAELTEIVQHDIWIVVHALWQVDILLTAKFEKLLQIWLKMDSGMHRVGLSPADFSQAYARLNTHANIQKIVLMSHFANADNVRSTHTLQQIDVFKHALADLSLNGNRVEISLANSAAILGWQAAVGDWSRPGIMLYGADPLMNIEASLVNAEAQLSHANKLRAVMQLTSKIISMRQVKKGESIGYGSLFTAESDTMVGVVACGYADGYPRGASHGAPAAVDGIMTRLIGRVSMDMLFVDLTPIPTAKVGSMVELWGEQVAANDVAKAAGTIAYELFCNVKRVQFTYSDNQ